MIDLKTLKPIKTPQPLEKFKKTSDLLSLLAVYSSEAQFIDVIIRLKENANVPEYCTERSRLPLNLVTANISVDNLYKLESDDNVLAWNCAKPKKPVT